MPDKTFDVAAIGEGTTGLYTTMYLMKYGGMRGEDGDMPIWSKAVFWPESGERMVQKAIQEFGRIDGLVNKAVQKTMEGRFLICVGVMLA